MLRIRKRTTTKYEETNNVSHRNVAGLGSTTFSENNREIWVQLGEEARNTNLTILEIVKELNNEMARLREDNVRLTMEQERIMKSLFDK